MRRRYSSSARIYYPRFSLEEIVRLLREKARKLDEKLPLVKVVLFGSYAKGRATAASDIDVLVVYKGERREDAYSIAWDALYLPQIQLHVYSESEYEKLRGYAGSLVAVAEKEGVLVFAERQP